MALLVASAAGPAAPQSSTSDGPPPVSVNQPSDQHHALASLPAVTPRHKTHRLQIDPMIPAGSDGSPGQPAEGRFHFFDGALQQYVNVNNPYLMGRMHNAILPFGGTAVLPVANGRVELHGGIGEIFVPYATPYTRPNSWLAQTSFGARVALDSGHHVWLGGTAYYLTDFADKTRRWGYGVADLTIRFGR
jgi:hypothetical protein